MTNWAIVIGVNHYEHLPPSKHLQFAVRDAEAMKAFLCDRAGFPPENVLLCSDDSQNVGDISTRPSLTSLRRLLLEHIQQVSGADYLWFFFAGHGISKNHQDYLLPRDGYPFDPEGSAISLRFVVDCLRRCQARNIILALDMCRDGRVEANSSRGIDNEIGRETIEITRQQGIITVFSCSPGQSSYEIPEIEQGAFTHTLLNGIPQSGSLRQLERYLYQELPALTQRYGKPKQMPLVVLEPGWKYDLPLLSAAATTDTTYLIALAREAELDGEFEKAKNLWWLVIGAAQSKPEILEKAQTSLERINRKQGAAISLPDEQSSARVSSLPRFSFSVGNLFNRKFLNYALIATMSCLAVVGIISVRSFLPDRPDTADTIDSTLTRFADVENVPQGTFTYSGSTASAAIDCNGKGIHSKILEAQPGFQLRYISPSQAYPDSIGIQPNSGTGIRMLLDGRVDFALSSRSLNPSETDKAVGERFNLVQKPVARDVSVFIVDRDFDIENIRGLTISELRDIYTGKITNWQQVRGPDLPIIPYVNGAELNAVYSFQSEVLKGNQFGSTVVEVDTTESATRMVADPTKPGGLYRAPAANVYGQGTVKPLPIGTTLENLTVPFPEDFNPLKTCAALNEQDAPPLLKGYPIELQQERLYVIVKDDTPTRKRVGEAYAELLETTEGQRLLQQIGFQPVNSNQ